MATTEEESKKNHEEEGVDRLSDLPDGILLHILSFLPGIKRCVQTTLLSKRWNNLWAFLPDLIFDTYESTNADAGSFNQFVRNVLNRRQNLPLNKFSIKYYQTKDSNQKKYKSLITTIINYAMSHNVQHFSLNLESASLTCLFPLFNISSSLKTLNLESLSVTDAHLLQGFTLPTLTTLYLRGCYFNGYELDNGEGEPVSMDPFVGFFNLKSLQLDSCSFWIDSIRNFKISGPQLDSLSVTSDLRYKAEVFAPKLRFFTFKCVCPLEFSGLDFPLLEVAVINFFELHPTSSENESSEYESSENESFENEPFENQPFEKSVLNLINMFRGLSNARSLVVSSRMIEDLMRFLDVLEDSPFVRLETLKVECPPCSVSSFEIPDNVVKYFGKHITVEKTNW